jgi:hypothetical protein
LFSPDPAVIVPHRRRTASPHHVGVVIVLAVVFPEADRADIVPTALIKGEASATWTAERASFIRRGPDRVGIQLLDVPLEPLPATLAFFR